MRSRWDFGESSFAVKPMSCYILVFWCHGMVIQVVMNLDLSPRLVAVWLRHWQDVKVVNLFPSKKCNSITSVASSRAIPLSEAVGFEESQERHQEGCEVPTFASALQLQGFRPSVRRSSFEPWRRGEVFWCGRVTLALNLLKARLSWRWNAFFKNQIGSISQCNFQCRPLLTSQWLSEFQSVSRVMKEKRASFDDVSWLNGSPRKGFCMRFYPMWNGEKFQTLTAELSSFVSGDAFGNAGDAERKFKGAAGTVKCLGGAGQPLRLSLYKLLRRTSQYATGWRVSGSLFLRTSDCEAFAAYTSTHDIIKESEICRVCDAKNSVMERWKSRGGKSQRGEVKKWEDKRWRKSEETRCRCTKR